MKRRGFIAGAVSSGAAAAWIGARELHARGLPFPALAPLARKFTASDAVTLGKTGIQTSRLAMGTGTFGSGHRSNQSALGIAGLSSLLQNGYDHGLRFFDTADAYGTHEHVADALKHVDRSKVVILTKTWSRDAASARGDLDRFRREL